MASCTVSKQVNAPVEKLFAAVTNIPEAPSVNPAIKKVEMLTEGPVGKGTRWRETRVMFGKEATETMEVTGFEPGRAMTVEARSCGMHYVSRFDFRPDGEGSRVEMTFSGTPETLMAKVMSPLGSLMMGTARKLLEKDLDCVKAALESTR